VTFLASSATYNCRRASSCMWRRGYRKPFRHMHVSPQTTRGDGSLPPLGYRGPARVAEFSSRT
jgi:hypothetical protein